MKKVLPEKEKAVKPAQDAKGVGQKSIDEVLAKIKAAPGGKPDAALEKALKDAQEKLAPLTMTETSALAAVSATKSNIVDAEAEVKRINDSKAKNAQAVAAANAAITTAKQSQDKAAAALTAAKASLTKPSTKPVAVALSPDGWRAAAVFDDGRLTVWAIATGTAIEDQAGLAAPNATLAARQDGAFTATSPDGKARVAGASVRWVLERTLGGEKEPQLLADRVNAVKFSPDGKLLATGGGEPSRSGDLTLFDAATGKATATWKERHSDIVMSLDFSPDGKRLASGAADKIARVTEIATGKQVNLLEGHTHYVMGVAFRADGRVLASGGADSVVISWDMILGERKKKIEGWTKEVTSVQFVGATNQIVTSAGDNRVRIVNDEGGEVRSITGLPDFMQAAASTANGATLVGGGEDSTLRIWNGTDGKELAAFAAK
jgi:WD40 repeat protein